MSKEFFDERLIHIADIKKYLVQCKKKFIFFSLLSSLCVFLFISLKEPKYVATATFKEGEIKSETSSSKLFKKLFDASTNTDLGTYAQTLMVSRTLLFETIQKLSLQASVKEKNRLKIFQRRFLDQYAIAKGQSIQDIRRPFVQNVKYNGETKKSFLLEMRSEGAVFLTDLETNKAQKIHSGETFSCEEVSFSVTFSPQEFLTSKSYVIDILPMELAYEKIKKSLVITVKKDQQKLLDLSFEHRDRYLAARLLNEHMKTYKESLQKEQETMAQEQLAFLSKRQEEIAKNLEDSLVCYRDYIKAHYGDEGFLNLAQQLSVLEDQKKDYLDQLFNIDIKLAKYESKKDFDGHSSYLEPSQMQLQTKINHLKKRKKALQLYELFNKTKAKGIMKLHSQIDPFVVHKLHHLKCQSDAKLSLSQEHILPIFDHVKIALADLRQKQRQLRFEKRAQNFFLQVDEKARMLKELKNIKTDAKGLLSKLDRGLNVDLHKTSLSGFFKGDIDLEQDKIRNHLLKHFLTNLVDLTSLKESLQHEALFFNLSQTQEFEGLDLESIDKLYFQTIDHLDLIRLEKSKLELATQKMQTGAFEMSSLSSLSTSPAGQDITQGLSKLYYQLRDEPNLTFKDKERLQRAIDHEMINLKRYLHDQIDLLNIQETMNRQKIDLIKGMQFQQINQEIILLEQQFDEMLHSKLLELKREKQYLHSKLSQIGHLIKTMPEKWLMENKLQFATDVNLSIMEGISHLVESKNIDHQLMHIESKPIDKARPALKPKNNHLWLLCFIGGFFGGFFVLAVLLLKKIQTGLPLSLEGLKSKGFKTFGKISDGCLTQDFSALSKADLTALRYMVRFIMDSSIKKVGFVLNGDINYVTALANLIAMSGKKILLIETFPKKMQSKGLIHFLMGDMQVPHIISEDQFDILPLGEAADYVPELLSRESFLKLLNQCEDNYDMIFLITREGILSPISYHVLDKVDKCIITVSGESMEDLQGPFFNDMNQVGFVSN